MKSALQILIYDFSYGGKIGATHDLVRANARVSTDRMLVHMDENSLQPA